MKPLNIGHIGCGGRSGLVQHAHQPERGSQVVAVADIDESEWEKARGYYGNDILATADYREILQATEVDAVFITTPDFLHEEMAVAALEAGKMVYLEKPMAISVEGCDRILETAFRTGVRLYLGHNMRHFPVVLKMKQLIDSGAIGQLQAVWCRHFVSYGGDAYFKDWHSERRYANSLLLQKGAHDIDVIHWLAGAYSRRVNGMGQLSVYDRCERRAEADSGITSWSNANWPPLAQTGLSPRIDVEDHNMILMQLSNGVQASYTQCHYTPDSCRNYTFIGTEGRIENIGDYGRCQVLLYSSRNSKFHQPDVTHQLFEVTGGHGGSDPAIVDEFLRFARDGGKTNTNPVAARQAVAAGVLGAESIRSDGAFRELPELDPQWVAYFDNGQQR